MRKGVDDAALADMASGADHHMRFDDHIAFDHRVGGQEYSFGRDHRDACFHGRLAKPGLQRRLSHGKDPPVIHAHHLGLVDHGMADGRAIGLRDGDDVCQIILALGIVVGHPVKPGEER